MPRWVHHYYAKLTGHFWLECRRCGRMFGGHEVRGSYRVTEQMGWLTCCPPDQMGVLK
jgi:hypothetical protein